MFNWFKRLFGHHKVEIELPQLSDLTTKACHMLKIIDEDGKTLCQAPMFFPDETLVSVVDMKFDDRVYKVLCIVGSGVGLVISEDLANRIIEVFSKSVDVTERSV